jgi:hypothetical protein
MIDLKGAARFARHGADGSADLLREVRPLQQARAVTVGLRAMGTDTRQQSPCAAGAGWTTSAAHLVDLHLERVACVLLQGGTPHTSEHITHHVQQQQCRTRLLCVFAMQQRICRIRQLCPR